MTSQGLDRVEGMNGMPVGVVIGGVNGKRKWLLEADEVRGSDKLATLWAEAEGRSTARARIVGARSRARAGSNPRFSRRIARPDLAEVA